jgi:hypothetical protein
VDDSMAQTAGSMQFVVESEAIDVRHM